ncbi:MAG: hypothetical protein H7338_22520 [Candidatus Sericytochromatia bacterium]|nr:hypothetical protein [Candidatus Sericytochromatia bacterium]
MEPPSDPRFRSFLWSQTRKKFYEGTCLTVPDHAPTEPVTPPPSVAVALVTQPQEPAGVPKCLPTRLDQGTVPVVGLAPEQTGTTSLHVLRRDAMPGLPSDEAVIRSDRLNITRPLTAPSPVDPGPHWKSHPAAG